MDGLLDRRLFLPPSSFSKEQKERWDKTQIPNETIFKTKPQLALEMVQNLRHSQLFPAQWITCDDFFGNSPEFIDHLPDDLFYLADVPSSTPVWRKPPQLHIPSYPGRGRPLFKTKLKKGEPKTVPVSQIAKAPSLRWLTVTLAEGAKGPRRAKVARLRVTVSRHNSLPIKPGSSFENL